MDRREHWRSGDPAEQASPAAPEPIVDRAEMARWGQRLRARRVALKLPLREVAATTGLSISYLAKLERGDPDALNPTRRVIDALRQTLQVPPPGGAAGWDAQRALANTADTGITAGLVPLEAALPSDPIATRGRQVTALLFSVGALSLVQIAVALQCALFEAQEGLDVARRQLAGSGLAIQENNGVLALCTAPDLGPGLQEPLAALGKTPPARVRLTPTQLETLAIIAVHQPVTLGLVERIRGASSERALHALLDYGLIAEAESPAPGGRARQYRTTARFLETFGLADLAAVQAAWSRALVPANQTEGG
jgi:chromosome segregation and condensation protein ScpB